MRFLSANIAAILHTTVITKSKIIEFHIPKVKPNADTMSNSPSLTLLNSFNMNACKQ